MNHIDAMKQALEALDQFYVIGYNREDCKEAHEALRLAIEQAERNAALDRMADNARELGLEYEPQQEPVAWRAEASYWTHFDSIPKEWRKYATPLYATPPQRQPDQLSGMSEINRTVAYCAANKLRELSYEWDGKDWQAPPQRQPLTTEEPILECLTANLHWDGHGYWLPDLCVREREWGQDYCPQPTKENVRKAILGMRKPK